MVGRGDGGRLHGVINLLTIPGPGQDSADRPPEMRCLAFCQLTNPLTWPKHVLLTPQQPNPTNLAAQGLPRGWEAGQTKLWKALPDGWGLCASSSCRTGRARRLTNPATRCWGVCTSHLPSPGRFPSVVEWDPSTSLDARGEAAKVWPNGRDFKMEKEKQKYGEGRLQGARFPDLGCSAHRPFCLGQTRALDP